jgi:hypothetical protein
MRHPSIGTMSKVRPSTPESIPTDLASPRAKLVYLQLRVAGAATTAELADRLDIGRLALYPVLELLLEAGHVRRDGQRYVPA